MADKEITIKVTTETDTSQLEALESSIDNISQDNQVNVNVDTSDVEKLTQEFEKAEEEVERLQDELDQAHFDGDDIQADIIADQLAEATAEAERLQDALDEMESPSVDVDTTGVDDLVSSAEDAQDALDSLNDTTVSPNVDTSGLDDVKEKSEEASSSMESIATAAVGIGAMAGIEEMVTTADRINTSWNQLELTFGDTAGAMDELKDKSSQLSETTGRAGGTVRAYFNQMGIAGVENTELLASSFEALSGKSYQTGNSIESMETRLQRMVMTGNASGMALQKLGIDSKDLANAMGVSAEQVSEAFKNLTPEERLRAISQAMGDGAEANDMYKNSYAGLKEQADAAMAGLMGAIGQAILPVVIPALQAVTQAIKMVTDGFKSLPGPVQAIIGGIGGFAAIAVTVVGVLGTVGQAVKMVKGGFEALGLISKISPIFSAISGAASSLWGVLIANPIILVVVAVAALIAALVWAYYNVDWFREMVDNAWKKLQEFAGYVMGAFSGALQWLGDAFNNVGQTMQDAITGAVDFIKSVLEGLWNYIYTVGGLLPANVDITGNQIVDTILRVMAFVQTLPFQIAMIFINIIASALGFGDNFCQTMIQSAAQSVAGFIQWFSTLPGKAGNYLSNMISRAASFAGTFATNIINGAINAVNGFISWIQSLPGKLQEELQKMLDMAANFAMEIADKLSFGGASMVAGWISGSGESSPGFMYDALIGELQAMANAPGEFLMGLISSIGEIGMQMASTLSEALFGINFDSVTNSISWLQSTLMGLWDYIVQLVAMVPVTIQSVAMQVMTSLQQVIAYIATLPGQIAAYLNQVISNAASFASRFVSNVSKAGSDAASQFVNSIKGLASGLASELQNMLSAVDQWAATLPQKFWDAGVNAVKNFLSALGIASPGTMQRMLVWEVTEMGKRVPEESRQLLTNVGRLGENIVDEFGEPTLGVRFDDTANASFSNLTESQGRANVINLNLEIGSVDNEDRIQEIVEAVRRELAWNNLLAGRTVND